MLLIARIWQIAKNFRYSGVQIFLKNNKIEFSLCSILKKRKFQCRSSVITLNTCVESTV